MSVNISGVPVNMTPSLEGGIINGTTTTIEKYPYQLQLQKKRIIILMHGTMLIHWCV
jgi:hypothetical protein